MLFNSKVVFEEFRCKSL